MKQRSILLFEQGINSESTRKNYTDHIQRFLEFTKLKDYDSILKIDPEQLQTIIEDYVMHLKKTINPNSVGTYMTGVKHFCVMNRIKIFWEIIQKMYPQKVKRSGQKAWQTEQIREMLDFSNSKRNKAIIHFLASTGGRIGIFGYPLQMRHLKNMDDNCLSVLLYAGEPDEYWSFLTPEATEALNRSFDERQNDGERFYPESPIFRTEYRLGIEKAVQLGRGGTFSMIYRLIKRAKIKRVRVNKDFDIQMDHGFRKRFNIILKLDNEINSNIAEKIMGHSVTIPLDGVYLPAEDPKVIEKCFSEFKKAVPELTIDPAERQRIDLETKQKKISELEDAKTTLLEMKKRDDERWEKARKYMESKDDCMP